jgi:hypothetical protein
VRDEPLHARSGCAANVECIFDNYATVGNPYGEPRRESIAPAGPPPTLRDMRPRQTPATGDSGGRQPVIVSGRALFEKGFSHEHLGDDFRSTPWVPPSAHMVRTHAVVRVRMLARSLHRPTVPGDKARAREGVWRWSRTSLHERS